MVRKVLLRGGEWWRVVGVYINKDMQRKLEEVEELGERRRN